MITLLFGLCGINNSQLEFFFFFLKSSWLLLCCLGGVEITNVESLQFDLDIVEAATNKFSEDNKIGEGGFGAVYMVKLS